MLQVLEMANETPVKLPDILKARERMGSNVHVTNVITNHKADATADRQLFFKAENLQKSETFKAKGALNSVLSLKERNQELSGVVAYSGGNCGPVTAWVSQVVGVPCVVIVPEHVPEVNKTAIECYGGEVVICGPDPADRERAWNKIVAEKGYEYLAPYSCDVIAGQGTIAVEFLEEVPQLDAILVAISGRGLTAGIAIAAKAIKPDIKIFLVQPEYKVRENCLKSGDQLWPKPPKFLETVVDGIELQQAWHNTFPTLSKLVEKEVFTMENSDMLAGMKFAYENMKLVIEAAAGAAVSAALSPQLKNLDSSLKNVGVILCEGHIDVTKMYFYHD